MSGFTPGTLYSADLNAALLLKEVRVASTANGTLASSFENGDTVDGVVLATGDRILLKDQTSGSENGIYVVAASGAPARAVDFDSTAEVVSGVCIVVQEGTSNKDSIWQLTTNESITLGTTALVFFPIHMQGTGSPESAVTAPIGATFRRTDGGTSTTLYVKESGTGTTGWAAVGGSAAFVGCRAIRTANQTITTATFTAVDFTAADSYDTDSMHNPASSSTRITVAAGKGGKYALDFHGHWAASATGQRFVKVRKNGTTDISGAGAPPSAEIHAIAINDVVDLAAADYIEILVYQSSGGDLVLREVDTASLRCSLIKVG